jgi:hypothetical protein
MQQETLIQWRDAFLDIGVFNESMLDKRNTEWD